MNESPDRSLDAAELRRWAEERLKSQRSEAGAQGSPQDTQRPLHELQVHQMELEVQNEELQRARREVDAVLAQYTDLYDFAPVGYFTLARDGTIRHANLAGARLLAAERSRLVGRRFGLFVSEDSRPAFNAFLEKVFSSRTRETDETALLKEGNQPLQAHIEATLSEDGQECRAVVVDITERKRAEAQIRSQLDELQRWHRVTLDREDRVQELKREVNELSRRLGEPVRYPSQETAAETAKD